MIVFMYIRQREPAKIVSKEWKLTIVFLRGLNVVSPDGNGRMARLWHTAILAKWKPVFEFIPIESRIEKFQDEYYDTIARCHVSGESTIFIEFMLSQIDRILEDISLQMNEENEQFSETVRKMLEIMEYDTPYTRKNTYGKNWG